jgi:hypothetical protein
MNRVELPLAVFRFALLREVDAMVFGVHGVHFIQRLVSGGCLYGLKFGSSLSFWTPEWTPREQVIRK